MKARVIKYEPWWYGEVRNGKSWDIVTINCYTRWGAKYELKKWIRENVPEEFDI